MRIAQITYTGFGGLGSVVFSLVGADKTNSHQWTIGFIGDLPLDDAYPPRCEKHGVSYAAFRSISGRPYRAWLALARWLTNTKPDAVICHSINSILACRWYAWRHGARLVAVEHTPNQVKTRNEWVFSRLSMLLADRVVVLTEEYRDELRHAHGWLFREGKVSVIANGIDTDVFFPIGNLHHGKPSVIRLGMAARFSFSKRQDMLIEMMSILHQKRPDFRFELHFVGNGEEMDKVMTLAKNSSIPQRIHFDGLISESDVASWLRDLDIYLHATSGESFCLSVLQAMATELPIVASKNVGITVLNRDCSTGILVDNDPLLWAETVLTLSQDPINCETMGRLARERAVTQYSADAMLNGYIRLLKCLQ